MESEDLPIMVSDSELSTSTRKRKQCSLSLGLGLNSSPNETPNAVTLTQVSTSKGKEKVDVDINGENEGQSAAMDSAPKTCGICKSGSERGIRVWIDSCDHYFCYLCIMEWSKVESHCPTCKEKISAIRWQPKHGVCLRERIANIPLGDEVHPSEVMQSQSPVAELPSHVQQPDTSATTVSQPYSTDDDSMSDASMEDFSPIMIKGRGRARGLKILSMPPGEKVKVSVNEYGQPCSKETAQLVTWIGILARDTSLLPCNYPDWRKVPNEYKENAWNKITAKFDIDGDLKRWALGKLNDRWRDFKCELKENIYDQYTAHQDRVQNCDERVPMEQWLDLLHMWDSERCKAMSQRNKINRSKLLMKHTAGKRSFAQIREIRRRANPHGMPPSNVELYFETHLRKDGTALDAVAENTLVSMLDLLDDHHGAQGEQIEVPNGAEGEQIEEPQNEQADETQGEQNQETNGGGLEEAQHEKNEETQGEGLDEEAQHEELEEVQGEGSEELEEFSDEELEERLSGELEKSEGEELDETEGEEAEEKQGKEVEEPQGEVLKETQVGELEENQGEEPKEAQGDNMVHKIFTQVMGDDTPGQVHFAGAGVCPRDTNGPCRNHAAVLQENAELRTEVGALREEISSLKSEFDMIKQLVIGNLQAGTKNAVVSS